MSDFIDIQSSVTTGTLGALPRAVVLVTRETVSGYSPSSTTGLIRINSSDYDAFVVANSTKYGLINALRVIFGQSYAYDYVYILSSASGVTSDELEKANTDPRAWSYISVVDRYNGGGTGAVSDTDYFADIETIRSWGLASNKKIYVGTYSVEEDGGPIVLPAELDLGSDIGSDNNMKIIVCNSESQVATVGGSPVYAYDNIALAWLSYNVSSAIARSWGSLSDSHDYLLVSSDTYSSASRSVISNASLGQYNAARDRGGSVFVYDTLMNDDVNPPLSKQIETLSSIYYIEDYVYVYVRNTLQAAGQTGLPTDNSGIQTVLGLTRRALSDCADLGLILTKEDNAPDFYAGALTASQVTAISPDWQTTGVWPAGVINATVRPFAASHYIKINFAFS